MGFPHQVGSTAEDGSIAVLAAGSTIGRSRISPQEAWANAPHDSVGVIGFAKRHGLPVRTTDEWMKIVREGEDD
jgi:hypothetical protein